MKPIDLSGRRFGMLTVVEKAPNIKYGNQSHVSWKCLCDCGNLHTVTGANLYRSTRSCGCNRNESIRKSKRKPQGHGDISIVFCDYRKSAQNRGLAFELTRDDVQALVSQNCQYCGQLPQVKFKKTHRSEQAAIHASFPHNGIDRVNNDLGYIKTNIVPCCDGCNYAKRGKSKEEFLDWIKKAYNHNFGSK